MNKNILHIKKLICKYVLIQLTLLRIFGMFHLGYALQAFGNLMEATLAAVQFQARLLAWLVKNILADGPASIIGNIATTSFRLLALFQAKEKFGLVAWTAGLVQIVCGARQGAGCTTRGILNKAAASSTYPILIPLELYKDSYETRYIQRQHYCTFRREAMDKLTIQR